MIIRKSVDFPAPLIPVMAALSVSFMWKEAFFRTTFSENALDRLLTDNNINRTSFFSFAHAIITEISGKINRAYH